MYRYVLFGANSAAITIENLAKFKKINSLVY